MAMETRHVDSRRFYILGGKDDREPVESDIQSWAQWALEDTERWMVAFDRVGIVSVSSVFTGLDPAQTRYAKEDAPLLFEVGLYAGTRETQIGKFSTWAEAEAVHRREVARLKAEAAARADRLKRRNEI
jgi:hypothetical protein